MKFIFGDGRSSLKISRSTRNETTTTREYNPKQTRNAAWIALILGIFTLIYGIVTVVDYNEKNKTYREIEARVVGYDTTTSTDEDGYTKTLYASILEYIVDGQSYKFTEKSYSMNKESIGERVTIKYDPENPKEAMEAFGTTYLLAILVGVCFIGGSIVLLVRYYKNN